jgi:hypothetical protein
MYRRLCAEPTIQHSPEEDTMVTMMEVKGVNVLFTSTPAERQERAWAEAVARVLDVVEANEWEDLPTVEPINLVTGVKNSGYSVSGWECDSRHQEPRFGKATSRKNRNTK